MKINDLRGLRAAISEYQRLERRAPESNRRRQELWAAISDYQRRFELPDYNPGLPFRQMRPSGKRPKLPKR